MLYTIIRTLYILLILVNIYLNQLILGAFIILYFIVVHIVYNLKFNFFFAAVVKGDLVWFDPGVGHVLPGEVLEYHRAAQVLTVQALIGGKVSTGI
jgi:hypothetical protein